MHSRLNEDVLEDVGLLILEATRENGRQVGHHLTALHPPLSLIYRC